MVFVSSFRLNIFSMPELCYLQEGWWSKIVDILGRLSAKAKNGFISWHVSLCLSEYFVLFLNWVSVPSSLCVPTFAPLSFAFPHFSSIFYVCSLRLYTVACFYRSLSLSSINRTCFSFPVFSLSHSLNALFPSIFNNNSYSLLLPYSLLYLCSRHYNCLLLYPFLSFFLSFFLPLFLTLLRCRRQKSVLSLSLCFSY